LRRGCTASAGNRRRSSAGTVARGGGDSAVGGRWGRPPASGLQLDRGCRIASPERGCGGELRRGCTRQRGEARVSPPSGRSGRWPKLPELMGRRRRPTLQAWRGRRQALGGAGNRRWRALGGAGNHRRRALNEMSGDGSLFFSTCTGGSPKEK
jgi:hypothetical protein